MGRFLHPVALSPTTANGWISILKVICTAMTKRYELARDPAVAVDYFDAPRIYTREPPSSLKREQVPIFFAKMKELHPASKPADSAIAERRGFALCTRVDPQAVQRSQHIARRNRLIGSR